MIALKLLLSVLPLSTYWCMHGTQKGPKPAAISPYSSVYWFFHALTSEQKDLLKIHESKTKKINPYCGEMYMYHACICVFMLCNVHVRWIGIKCVFVHMALCMGLEIVRKCLVRTITTLHGGSAVEYVSTLEK